MQTMPSSIWTLFDLDTNQITPSQEKLGSKLFQMIAIAVMKFGKAAQLSRTDVEQLQACLKADGYAYGIL
jgi:hypothetical protein